jgi:DNA-3-methyladenine glycosylase
MIVPREFYERDTLTVARELLGQIIVRRTDEGESRGIIVETEAYLGEKDDAAHSYKGKSARVRVQYGPAGAAYIYLIYGMYYCLNITAGPLGVPEVVLIRALEPVSGLEFMRKRRMSDKTLQLCSGPGKLCMALDINNFMAWIYARTARSFWNMDKHRLRRRRQGGSVLITHYYAATSPGGLQYRVIHMSR